MTAAALLCLLTTALLTGAAPAPRPPDRAWPVSPGGEGLSTERPAVERGWEPPPTAWSAGHRGVDLAARTGRPVRAAAAGRVSFAGRVAGRGVVSVVLPGTERGGTPLRTTYEPVRSQVSVGDRVTAGQVIGVLESGPFHCPRSCLHWGLLRGAEYLDPLSLLPPGMLRRGPSRLLPVLGVPLPEQEQVTDGGRAAPASSGGPSAAAVAAALALSAGVIVARRRLGGERQSSPGTRRRPSLGRRAVRSAHARTHARTRARRAHGSSPRLGAGPASAHRP